MGIYKNLELDFVDRTIRLILQYYDILENFDYEHQYNYTLLINCLLGLIILPKEKVISYTPNKKFTKVLLDEIGLVESEFGERIKTERDLVIGLRHAAAHFDIEVLSEDGGNTIEWIVFSDSENGGGLVAKFRSRELLSFLKYYSSTLIQNLNRYKSQ